MSQGRCVGHLHGIGGDVEIGPEAVMRGWNPEINSGIQLSSWVGKGKQVWQLNVEFGWKFGDMNINRILCEY